MSEWIALPDEADDMQYKLLADDNSVIVTLDEDEVDELVGLRQRIVEGT